jgi:single-strand DNA-binding protein
MTITIRGLVCTTPRSVVIEAQGENGDTIEKEILTFRFAEIPTDAGTNWYSVSCWKGLAVNGTISVSKGDRLIIVGDLRIRDWDNGERSGTSVELEAIAMGHDLNYGTTRFERTPEYEPKVVGHKCDCNSCDRNVEER